MTFYFSSSKASNLEKSRNFLPNIIQHSLLLFCHYVLKVTNTLMYSKRLMNQFNKIWQTLLWDRL